MEHIFHVRTPQVPDLAVCMGRRAAAAGHMKARLGTLPCLSSAPKLLGRQAATLSSDRPSPASTQAWRSTQLVPVSPQQQQHTIARFQTTVANTGGCSHNRRRTPSFPSASSTSVEALPAAHAQHTTHCGANAEAAAVMLDFLRAYGLQGHDIQRLSLECPQLFTSSSCDTQQHASSSQPHQHTHSTAQPQPRGTGAAAESAGVPTAAAAPTCVSCVYEVGRTLLFFHRLGWSHSSVLRRIVGLYPQLLTKQVDRDILPVLRCLMAMGCSPDDVRLLVWEFPRIFCSNNWRRHVRKFQYLGLYGLPAPGQQHSSSNSSGGSSEDHSGSDSSTDSIDSLERLLCWL